MDGQNKVKLPGTIYETAQEVTRLGGQGIGARCDHRNDQEVQAVFEQIRSEQNRLDILVNNVWGGYEHYTDGTEFWNEKTFGQRLSRVGMRCSRRACERTM